MRATMSDGPPGVLATTNFTGRSGYAAYAEPTRRIEGAARPAASTPVLLRTRRRDGPDDPLIRFIVSLFDAGGGLVNETWVDHTAEIEVTGIIEATVLAVNLFLVAQAIFEFGDVE